MDQSNLMSALPNSSCGCRHLKYPRASRAANPWENTVAMAAPEMPIPHAPTRRRSRPMFSRVAAIRGKRAARVFPAARRAAEARLYRKVTGSPRKMTVRYSATSGRNPSGVWIRDRSGPSSTKAPNAKAAVSSRPNTRARNPSLRKASRSLCP